jgi:hypothetical protein
VKKKDATSLRQTRRYIRYLVFDINSDLGGVNPKLQRKTSSALSLSLSRVIKLTSPEVKLCNILYLT